MTVATSCATILFQPTLHLVGGGDRTTRAH